jgi:hypothetical protein
MDPYLIIIVLCSLIIISYVLDLLARRIRIPTVLMLIGIGLVMQYPMRHWGITIPGLSYLLPILGAVGLVLIVLEASLHLELSRGKVGTILQAFLAALVLLMLTSLGIAWFIRSWTLQPFMTCLVNAVPFGIISSAIALPSVAHLAGPHKEFIIYEAVFSDILGIMLFNFLIANATITAGSFLRLGAGVLLVLALAVIGCLILLLILHQLSHHIKSFLIIAALVLVYALGKIFHLSSLLLVFVCGVFITHTHLFIPALFHRFLDPLRLQAELGRFRAITAESAFFVRTFFFLVFGFSITPGLLLDPQVLGVSLFIIALLVVVRFLYLQLVVRTQLIPALFIMPRGLITILLFYSIPPALQIPAFTQGVLLCVILFTSIWMTGGLLLTHHDSPSSIAPHS